MKNYIRPSELYEWTLNNLKNLTLEEQEITLRNLQIVKWVPEMIGTLHPNQRELFKHTIASRIDEPDTPFCLMSISCIVYNLKINGVEVTDLEQQINSSDRVLNEIKKMLEIKSC